MTIAQFETRPCTAMRFDRALNEQRERPVMMSVSPDD